MASLEQRQWQQQQQLWQQQQQQQVNYNLSTTSKNANYVTTSDHPSTTTAIAIAYDPEISPIPDQQAYAVLDLYGNIIRSTSTASTSTSSTSSSGGGGDIIKDAPTLYKMIVESTSLVLATSEFESAGQEEEKGSRSGFGLNRITITFDNAAIRYVIARDESHIYLLQTTTSTTTK